MGMTLRRHAPSSLHLRSSVNLLLSVWGVHSALPVEKVPFAGLPTWRMRAANHIRGLHEAM